MVVRRSRPLNLAPLTLVSCDLSLVPAAQPRNRWPPATCYTADGFRWCAERKWFVVVGRCRALRLEPLTLVSCDLGLEPAALPRNHWPPATCYTADGFSGCAERKGFVVVRRCRPLNLDALTFVSCDLSLEPAALPRNHWPPATCYTANGFGGCAERKWFCGRSAMQAIEALTLES